MANEPCTNCYIHGYLYSADNCNTCNYYKAVEIIKQLLPDIAEDKSIDFDKVLNEILNK
jgi:hypothetical protein